MAQLGRLQLLAVAVRRFLVQLKRRDARGYDGLAESLRQRDEPAETRLFGMGGKPEQPRDQALGQGAQDLAWLEDRFEVGEVHRGGGSYQDLDRLLAERGESK